MSGMRMAKDIGKRFLQYAKQRGSAVILNADIGIINEQLAFDIAATAELRHLPFDGNDQAEIQYGRPQVVLTTAQN
jgi:hypothetical protein